MLETKTWTFFAEIWDEPYNFSHKFGLERLNTGFSEFISEGKKYLIIQIN